MKLLADIHVFIWFFEGDQQLLKNQQALIEDTSNEVFLSFASLWEIAIKTSLGKLRLSVPFQKLIEEEIPRSNFLILETSSSHLVEVEKLSYYYRDPFDRMIITNDPKFGQYPVKLI